MKSLLGNGVGRRLVGLCGPPLAFCALDGTLTLLGQSADYWAGQYDRVNEASPTFAYLLTVRPEAFAVGLAVWAAVFVGVILLLPATPALIVSIGVTFGHAVGSVTWLLWGFQFSYQACNGVFLTAAVLLGLGIRYGWGTVPTRDGRLLAGRPVLNGVLAAALFGVGVYLFLWPR